MTPAGIAVTRWGEGDRQALMLHCSLAHAGAWSGVAARLDDRLSMTAPDLPGHGRSADWDGVTDYHSLATSTARSLAGDGPVDLVGHSLGATIALRLALEEPGLARTLTLIEPVLFAAARGTPAFADYLARHAPVEAAFASGDPLLATAHFMTDWGNGTPWDDVPPTQRQGLASRIHLVAAVAPVLGDDMAGLLAPGRLEALDVPVLLLRGARSPAVIGAIAATLLERLPDAREVVVPDAGHMLPITHPGPVAEAIGALLSRG